MRDKLLQLVEALNRHGGHSFAKMVKAAATVSDEELNAFLMSNDLWGGAASIADQAGMPKGKRSQGTREIENALTKLGLEQIRVGKVNIRTSGWVATFRECAKRGI